MGARVLTGALAGSGAAATAHALDAAGRLPYVHESVHVRTAMTPAQLLVWIVLAAGLSALAVTTRPLVVGAPAAVLVSGVPELLGRGDPGALVEPSALLGALLQVMLLVAVVAAAVVLERRIELCVVLPLRPPWPAPHTASLESLSGLAVLGTGEPRAPPLDVCLTTT